MWYQYQAVGSGGALVTWAWPTPDPTGAHAGQTVTDPCQLNDPPVNGSAVAWSGVGITGSATPTSLICGAGVSGSLAGGDLTLTTTPTLQTVTGDGDPIFTGVGKIYFAGLVVTQIAPDTIGVSATTQAVVHTPVDAVTCRNLASVTGGLALPTSSSEWIATYDGDQDNLANHTRVLVGPAQTTPDERGIYRVDTAGNRLVLSTDTFDIGHQVPVTNGRVWGATLWTYTAADTFSPPAGTATHTAWAAIDPDTTAIWINLLTVEAVNGVDAYQWHLHLDVMGSVCEGNTATPIVRTFRTYGIYACNPSGDMTSFGNSDGSLGLTFGEAWEDPIDYRLRAVVDGNAITIQGYRDSTAGGNKAYRYRLEVTSKLRQVVY
jgi:hypothetical protein